MLKAVRFRRNAPRSCCACPARSDGVAASAPRPSLCSSRAASDAGSVPGAAWTPMRCRVPEPPNRDWASAMSITSALRLPDAPQRRMSMNAPTRSAPTWAPARASKRSPADHPMAAANSWVTAAQPGSPTASASGASPESASRKSRAGASRSTPSNRTKASGRPCTDTVVSNTGQAAPTPGVARTRAKARSGSVPPLPVTTTSAAPPMVWTPAANDATALWLRMRMLMTEATPRATPRTVRP